MSGNRFDSHVPVLLPEACRWCPIPVFWSLFFLPDSGRHRMFLSRSCLPPGIFHNEFLPPDYSAPEPVCFCLSHQCRGRSIPFKTASADLPVHNDPCPDSGSQCDHKEITAPFPRAVQKLCPGGSISIIFQIFFAGNIVMDLLSHI